MDYTDKEYCLEVWGAGHLQPGQEPIFQRV